MWLIFQKEFDISQALEIRAITNRIIAKSFEVFETVSNFC